ncbi:hypothetical protein L6452_43835 [Arctium lappa]|uniref:Uncharacterized protein n=1 Tax=Arctium lappa TaxID=4217 RepID=A0ACB8XDH9_ARCLA|nr:hypothetical protein L6452_43835 [Arctium lappa]
MDSMFHQRNEYFDRIDRLQIELADNIKEGKRKFIVAFNKLKEDLLKVEAAVADAATSMDRIEATQPTPLE